MLILAKNGTDHIALISEWDTVYGQNSSSKPSNGNSITPVQAGILESGSDTDPPIYKFTYLRGLDGLLPAAESKEGQKQDKAN